MAPKPPILSYRIVHVGVVEKMLKKFIVIKNVGKFANYTHHGDLEFRKLTLVYAENGSGKTTLSTILRSFKTGDAAVVNAKKTLGAAGEIAISVLTENGMAQFRSGSWNQTKQNLEVFDSAFINNNVCSGYQIESEHRRNLCRFVLGEEGVRLVKEVEDLAQQYRDSGTSLTAAETKVKATQASPMEIATYLNLDENTTIEESIAAKEKQIATLRKASEVQKKSPPSKISLPVAHRERLVDLLSRRIEDVSSDAEAKTRYHVQQCLDSHGETWLSSGMSYIKDERCPLCRQLLTGSDIVKCFQEYFSESYTAFKQEIRNFGKETDEDFSNLKLVALTKLFVENEASFDYWVDHVSFVRPKNPAAEIEAIWPAIAAQIKSYVNRKLAAPLDPIEIDGDFLATWDTFIDVTRYLETYNYHVETITEQVALMKAELNAGNLNEALRELALFQNIRARHSKEAIIACEEYLAIVNHRKQLDKAKKDVKDRLDAYTDEIFGTYQERINGYLESFGAKFTITTPETTYAGGKPSSNYSLVINDCQVALAGTGTEDRPFFGNTLSEGDKSTLAFAFFLARLDADSDLGEKVVVFDDPISSLDIHRKHRTQQQISQVLTRAKQVIVLSHDAFFLRQLWDNTVKAQCRTLKIARTGHSSTISEWDIIAATRPEYFRNFYQLLGFLERGHDGDLTEIARCIRVYLEGNLRLRFPNHFSEDTWLGGFVDKVRSADDGDDLAILKPQLEELSDVNDFSKRFHHDQTPSAPPSR